MHLKYEAIRTNPYFQMNSTNSFLYIPIIKVTFTSKLVDMKLIS